MSGPSVALTAIDGTGNRVIEPETLSMEQAAREYNVSTEPRNVK